MGRLLPSRGRHRSRSRRGVLKVALVAGLGLALVGGAAVAYRLDLIPNPFEEKGDPPTLLRPGTTPDEAPIRGIDEQLGLAWVADRYGPINTSFEGLTTFRGNASRTYYGQGPVPEDPQVLWRYPAGEGRMCMESTNIGETKVWCGMGWTGQPNVIEQEDGSIEVRFGAYDGRYHFLDGETGKPVRADLITGDLAKGSATTDPDGFPLYYAGSRDNFFRIVALDREVPTVLWSIDSRTSVPGPRWNDDWDGAALVVGDYLLEGGENSWFYLIRLNRGYGADGLVTVNPEVVATLPAFDDELLDKLDDDEPRTSIEASVAYFDGVAYVANSAGLILGLDLSQVLLGQGTEIPRVFRYWTGDDTDSSVVVDEDGFLYVASELERFNARSDRVGQLLKLDPRNQAEPLVWSVAVTERGQDGNGGLFSTPALHGRYLYASTNAGSLFAVDRHDGRIVWRLTLADPTWGSPVVVDDTLIQGDCEGVLHAFDVSSPGERPSELWQVQLEGCIEATPAVWEGRIFVGTREGPIYALGDRS